MPRGYLWTHLTKDVVEEFALFTPEMPLGFSPDSKIWYTMWAAEELRRLPEYLQKRIRHLNYSDGAKKRNDAKKETQVRPRAKPKPRIPPTPTRYQIDYMRRKAQETNLVWTQKDNRHEAFRRNKFIGYYVVLDDHVRASLAGGAFKICGTEDEAKDYLAGK